jgi:hypothetical protein
MAPLLNSTVFIQRPTVAKMLSVGWTVCGCCTVVEQGDVIGLIVHLEGCQRMSLNVLLAVVAPTCRAMLLRREDGLQHRLPNEFTDRLCRFWASIWRDESNLAWRNTFDMGRLTRWARRIG